jgi:hypothetical protein
MIQLPIPDVPSSHSPHSSLHSPSLPNMPDPAEPGTVKCTRCPYRGLPETFPAKSNGAGFVKACYKCTTKANNDSLANKRKKEAEATSNDGTSRKRVYRNAGISTTAVRDSPIVHWNEFQASLAGLDEFEELHSWVRISLSGSELLRGSVSREALIKAIAREIWEATGYRWM